ncbi:uncharacterized protein LOC112516753 [Cynara cardunculus var. scolymus]|uniref:uncharacterized protein LOC112516753 n=1 Tax=Cynara cardunculus var. scolymus TaxID=59895 RepID=UPI000D62E5C1|nr:uncharacterized protein LOC112516753 [Cynara cardunculus var. scolymus]
MEFFDFCNQVVHGRIFHLESKVSFHCSMVYAANSISERRELWDAIRLHNRMDLNLKVRDVVIDGLWAWPMEIWSKYGEILKLYLPPLIDGIKDKVKWKNKDGVSFDFSVAAVWRDIRDEENMVKWANMIWFSQGSRHAFILWLAIRNRLRTKDRLGQWSLNMDTQCVIWSSLESIGGIGDLKSIIESEDMNWDNLVMTVSNKITNNSIWSIFQRLVLAAVIYFVWKERNIRIHHGKERSVVVLAKQIFMIVKLRLMGLKIQNNSQIRRAAVLRGLKMCEDEFVDAYHYD